MIHLDLNVIKSRSQKTASFQKLNYRPEETAIINLSSGAEFINGKNTFLIFQFELYENTGEQKSFTWGHRGSAMNILKNVVAIDKSGNEIERIKNVDHLANALVRYNESLDFVTKYGQIMGLSNMAYEDIESEINNISAPTLILHGENDLIFSGHCPLVLARIGNGNAAFAG